MFKKNLEALQLKNPELAKKLAGILIDDISDNMEVFEAESGDVIISYQGLALDDIYNPIRVAKTNWNTNVTQKTNPYDIILVYGLGLGYLFKRAYVSCNSRILLYEPNIDILRYVLEYVDFSDVINDSRVFITCEQSECVNYLNEKYLSDDNLIFLYPDAYMQLMGVKMAEFTNAIVDVCNMKKMDVNTVSKLAKNWATHALCNIFYLQKTRPLMWLKNFYKGKIALIAAAGPSLKENIETIKANRNKFIIFAVNRTISTLYDNGIEPDFILFSDVVYIAHTFEGYENKMKNSNLIVDFRSNNSIFKTFDNILTYFTKNDLIAQYIGNALNNEFDLSETAGTSTAQAYYSAKLLGIDKIIFAGLDLAFKDNVMYSDGKTVKIDENNQIEFLNTKRNVMTVKNVKGEDVLTRDDYALFIRQFEEIFQKDTTSKIYNISDFGALIKGMEYKSLPEILSSESEFEINTQKDIESFKLETENKWNDILANLKSILIEEKVYFVDIARKTGLLLEKEKTILAQLNANDKQDTKDVIDELSRLTQEFSKLLPDILKDAFLSQYFQSEFMSFINMSKNNKDNLETFIKMKNFEIELLEKISAITMKWAHFIHGKFM